MAACRACSTPVPGEEIFCPECGTTLSEEISPTLVPGTFTTVPAQLKHPRGLGEMRLVPGTILAHRYRIVTQIGQGGMGEVYRADDLRLGQTVALKFLADHLAHSPAALARFHQEVRLARQIAHPSVCRVFDIGDAEGRPFLAMEYIDGEDLAALLRRIGRLPVDKGLEIAQQLCTGLAAIHDSGILHRDLKPANILIDARGRARITDFGISALTEELPGDRRIGTPAYMAPEQLAGGEITVRTDLYALGLILYEMLTGCPAFGAANPQEPAAERRAAKRPVVPSALVREIDPRTESALLRCLAPDPAARPTSALHLATLLPVLDPLAAAVAPGEPSSPAQVVTASKGEGLSPAVAATLLGIAVLLSLTLVLSARDRRIVNRLQLDQPPEVMAHRVRDILSKLGYTQPPRAWAYWYASLIQANAYQRALLISGQLQEARDFSRSRAPQMVFVYRESPRPLAPRGPVISGSDPPVAEPGEALVWLDPEGRLRRLVVVADHRLGERPPTPPDWRALLEAADLDPRKLTAVDPQWIPPVAVDILAAWKGVVQISPGTSVPFRAEMGSYRGAPVYFEMDEEYPDSMMRDPSEIGTERTRTLALRSLYAFFFGTVVLGGALLARRHLRLRRGDSTWATRLAVFTFLFVMANSVLLVGRLWSEADDEFWLTSIGRALTQAALVWLSYRGLEPVLRRKWPEKIVSWSRLLGGAYRDPMVGRDMLIGCIFGLGLLLAFRVRQIMQIVQHGGGQDVVFYEWISSTSHFLKLILDNLLAALLMPLCFLIFLLSLKIVLRREWAAALSLWLLLSVVLTLRHPMLAIGPVWPWLVAASASALFVLAWARFGLLVGVVQWLTLYMGQGHLLSADLSSWYAVRLFAVGAPLVLAVYGFVVSTAGQRWIPDEVLDG